MLEYGYREDFSDSWIYHRKFWWVLKVKAVLNMLFEGTSNHSCKVSKRYFIATAEKLRLRRYIRTQRSRMCRRMTFQTWLMIKYAQNRKTEINIIFILRSSVWMTTKIALVCDLLVFYKTATNMLQTCYKFAIFNPMLSLRFRGM